MVLPRIAAARSKELALHLRLNSIAKQPRGVTHSAATHLIFFLRRCRRRIGLSQMRGVQWRQKASSRSLRRDRRRRRGQQKILRRATHVSTFQAISKSRKRSRGPHSFACGSSRRGH